MWCAKFKLVDSLAVLELQCLQLLLSSFSVHPMSSVVRRSTCGGMRRTWRRSLAYGLTRVSGHWNVPSRT